MQELDFKNRTFDPKSKDIHMKKVEFILNELKQENKRKHGCIREKNCVYG